MAMRVEPGPHNERAGKDNSEVIDVALYLRLAGDDLILWRDLVGRTVVHHDDRYGVGTITDARWATFCEHVPEYIQIRVEHEHGLTAVFRAAALDETHRDIEVPQEAAELVHRCFGPDAVLGDAASAAAVARYAEETRARHECLLAERIAAKRRKRTLSDAEGPAGQ